MRIFVCAGSCATAADRCARSPHAYSISIRCPSAAKQQPTQCWQRILAALQGYAYAVVDADGSRRARMYKARHVGARRMGRGHARRVWACVHGSAGPPPEWPLTRQAAVSTAITKQLQTSSAVLLEPMMDVEALASPAPRTGGQCACVCERTHACICVSTRKSLCQRACVGGFVSGGARRRGDLGDTGAVCSATAGSSTGGSGR